MDAGRCRNWGALRRQENKPWSPCCAPDMPAASRILPAKNAVAASHVGRARDERVPVSGSDETDPPAIGGLGPRPAATAWIAARARCCPPRTGQTAREFWSRRMLGAAFGIRASALGTQDTSNGDFQAIRDHQRPSQGAGQSAALVCQSCCCTTPTSPYPWIFDWMRRRPEHVHGGLHGGPRRRAHVAKLPRTARPFPALRSPAGEARRLEKS